MDSRSCRSCRLRRTVAVAFTGPHTLHHVFLQDPGDLLGVLDGAAQLRAARGQRPAGLEALSRFCPGCVQARGIVCPTRLAFSAGRRMADGHGAAYLRTLSALIAAVGDTSTAPFPARSRRYWSQQLSTTRTGPRTGPRTGSSVAWRESRLQLSDGDYSSRRAC